MKSGNRRIEFSILYGENAYIIPEEAEKQKVFWGTHIKSNTSVRLERVNIQREMTRKEHIHHYDVMILNPPDLSVFDWPNDLTMFHTEKGELVYCLVFADNSFLQSTPFRKIVFQPKSSNVLDWRNSYIKTLLLVFLQEISEFRKSGYLYIDYDIDHIYFDEIETKVYFGFSDFITTSKKIEKCIFNIEELHPEFQSPYIYSSEFESIFSSREDNYSIAAILFYLMIGRLPYEGKGLYHHGTVFDPGFDTDFNNHIEFFRQYHKYPYFIFESSDRRNEMGNMDINSLPKERWDSLPAYIKESFKMAFQHDSVIQGKGESISPKEWLNYLERLYQTQGN